MDRELREAKRLAQRGVVKPDFQPSAQGRLVGAERGTVCLGSGELGVRVAAWWGCVHLRACLRAAGVGMDRGKPRGVTCRGDLGQLGSGPLWLNCPGVGAICPPHPQPAFSPGAA